MQNLNWPRDLCASAATVAAPLASSESSLRLMPPAMDGASNLLQKDVDSIMKAVTALNNDSISQATSKTTSTVSNYLHRLVGVW